MSDLDYSTLKVIDKGDEPLGNTTVKYSKISKWQLLRMVQEILEDTSYRVLNCQKQIGQVQVKRGAEGEFLGGIISCDSVWLCPVCNLRKSAQRGDLIRQTDNNGFYQAMLTLTLQHNKGDSLDDLLSALKDASSELKQGGFWHRLKKEFKIKAYMTSTEITFGYNGWHPHIHMILYFDGKPDLDILWEKLVERWIHVCGKVGRYASRFHSLDLTRSSGDQSADYMTKFRGGLSYEMTGQFNKSSGKGLTFWDLVRRRDKKRVI
ncbi:MAG: protein rep, partial [Thermotogota bacterium]|nr:protein rep [Thermotogota bacterium]